MIQPMGLTRSPFRFLPLLLLISTILDLIPPSKSAADYTTIVYKGCAKQVLSDPTGVYSQALSSLYGTLLAQSSKSKFYKTSTGSGQSSISGLFQCRGDLSNVDCYSCVSKLPILIDKLCGKPIAARMQLYGCYMLYEVAGFAQISGMEMLYKSCSGTNVGGAGFEERRDTALNSLENGMSSSNGGFYTTSYQSVYVLGQCEGDVGASDCVECVKNAVQRAQVECGSSISGQIYLHKCFMSYSYYPNGVPKKSSSASYSSPSSSSGPGPNTGKTVAIIVGGAAGVGFLVICLLFARGLLKKKDVYPKVKVREEVEEADQYEYERSSLQSLKAFEWLSLDHYSSGESTCSVVRIPASYLPKSQPSKEEVSKNKKPLIHGTSKHTRAASAPRLHPQPVSSSPFPCSDDGSKTQIRSGLLSPLKSHNSCHRHTRCKIFPASGDSEIGARQRQGHHKHSMESKKTVGGRGRTPPADGEPQKKNHQH